jgi:hypothetical protein
MPQGICAIPMRLFALLAAFSAPVTAVAQSGQDAALRQAIVEESIVQYRGTCACPDSIMRNGRRCGANSAWSKGGGQRPLCSASDVTPQMLEAYKARKGLR